MLTQNCDAHPLLKLMHRPELDRETKAPLPADKQDKRAVVPIERAEWETWLHGTVEDAQSLIGLPRMECIRHGPADASIEVTLPV